MWILRVLGSIVLVTISLIFFAVFMIREDIDHGGHGLCQEFSEDQKGPLADVTSPDGKYRGYVYLGACGFMGSDLVTTIYIRMPWNFYPLNVLDLAEDPHINLEWKDNHTLLVNIDGYDAPADKDVDGIHIEFNPTKRIQTPKPADPNIDKG